VRLLDGGSESGVRYSLSLSDHSELDKGGVTLCVSVASKVGVCVY